ncbi:hypothetical protein BJX63DRAFT_320897 [Aspergillus granulosus]|uniref:Uncharacterized protein n=1 Tax=Aspergillus granulosus TaxID=176169 RepID=A0ABR4H4R1_9EURO
MQTHQPRIPPIVRKIRDTRHVSAWSYVKKRGKYTKVVVLIQISLKVYQNTWHLEISQNSCNSTNRPRKVPDRQLGTSARTHQTCGPRSIARSTEHDCLQRIPSRRLGQIKLRAHEAAQDPVRREMHCKIGHCWDADIIRSPALVPSTDYFPPVSHQPPISISSKAQSTRRFEDGLQTDEPIRRVVGTD